MSEPEKPPLTPTGEYRANTPRYDLLPPQTIRAAALTMLEGLKTHTEGDWKNVPTEEHVNRMMDHWIAYLDTGKKNEIDHFLTRAILVHASETISRMEVADALPKLRHNP